MHLSFIIVLLFGVLPVCGWADNPALPQKNVASTARVVTTGLVHPYTMVHAPDGSLWITERAAARIVRIDPQTGQHTVLLTIEDVAVVKEYGQGGLLGLQVTAAQNNTWQVFISMTSRATGSGATGSRATDRTLMTLLRRYTYDPVSRQFSKPHNLLTGLPAGVDHQSGRFIFGPEGYIYLSTGDMGANTGNRSCRRNLAQRLPTAAEVRTADWRAYAGKILRIRPDGGVPDGNPLLNGVRSHVYAYGLRNSQGLTFTPDGFLFAVEHGPRSDDELNRIISGGNYGWPYLAGYRDDKAYEFVDFAASEQCARLKDAQDADDVPEGVPVHRESDWSVTNEVQPLVTFYTVDSKQQFMAPECRDQKIEFACYATIAPSSIKYVPYPSGSLGSLLITSLKGAGILKVPLLPQPDVHHIETIFNSTDRFRDVVFAENERTAYVLTDSEGAVVTGHAQATTELAHPGSVLAIDLQE